MFLDKKRIIMSLTRRNSKILECLTQIVQDNREEDMSISAIELVKKVTNAVDSLIVALEDKEITESPSTEK